MQKKMENFGKLLLLLAFIFMSHIPEPARAVIIEGCSEERQDKKSSKMVIEGDYGEWQCPVYCPKGSYVYGITNYVEPDRGGRKIFGGTGDDTGLNTLQIHCKDLDGNIVYPIKSFSNDNIFHGEWTPPVVCSGERSYLTGLNVKYERPFNCEAVPSFLRWIYDKKGPDTGCNYFEPHRYKVDDKTSANLVGGWCNHDYDNFLAPHLDSRFGNWGNWITGESHCPREACSPGQAICGIRTRVEASCGGNCDDTALNGLIIKCCEILNDYSITVSTGDFLESGTNQPVLINIVGSERETGWFVLSENGFVESGPIPIIASQIPVGLITGVQIKVKNGPGPNSIDNWYLEYLTIKYRDSDLNEFYGDRNVRFEYYNWLDEENNDVIMDYKEVVYACEGIGEGEISPIGEESHNELQNDKYIFMFELFWRDGNTRQHEIYTLEQYRDFIQRMKELYRDDDNPTPFYVSVGVQRNGIGELVSTPYMRVRWDNLYIDALLDDEPTINNWDYPTALMLYNRNGEYVYVPHVGRDIENPISHASLAQSVIAFQEMWNNPEGRLEVEEGAPDRFVVRDEDRITTTNLILMIAETVRFVPLELRIFQLLVFEDDQENIEYFRPYWLNWRDMSLINHRDEYPPNHRHHWYAGLDLDEALLFFRAFEADNSFVRVRIPQLFCPSWRSGFNHGLQSEEESCNSLDGIHPVAYPNKCAPPSGKVHLVLTGIDESDSSITSDWSVTSGPSAGTLSSDGNSAYFSSLDDGIYTIQAITVNGCGDQSITNFQIEVSPHCLPGNRFKYLGEGECRQENGNYGLDFFVWYSDLTPHTSGNNAQIATERCISDCANNSDWCRAAEVVLRDVWSTPACSLITDVKAFAAAGETLASMQWGATQVINDKGYQTLCAGNGNADACAATKYGKGSLNPREGYHCYERTRPTSVIRIEKDNTGRTLDDNASIQISEVKIFVNNRWIERSEIAWISSSGSCYGTDHEYAFDRSSSTSHWEGSTWHSCNDPLVFLEIGLVTPSMIDRVEIINRSDCCGHRLDGAVLLLEDEPSNTFWRGELNSSLVQSFTIEESLFGSLRHVNSGQCVHPNGGSPTPNDNTELIFHEGCAEGLGGGDRLRYELLDDGSIRHISSGKCIHPLGGSPAPDNNTPLVLHNGCASDPGGGDRLRFELLDNGSIRHISSGKCIHPLGGSPTPENQTTLVLHSGCGENVGHPTLRFGFD